jgi:SLT domain-containing protein
LGLTTGEAGVLGGAGIAGGVELARQVPGILQAVQQHPVATGISALAGVGAIGSRMGATRRLDALLDMASSTDPQVARKAADTLAAIASKNTAWERALDKIENTLGIYLAQHHMGEPNLPGVGPIGYEERKVGRKSGGRVTAEGLVAAAEKAKKAVNKTTEPLLNKDDTSVARALEVANRHIEG